MSKTISQKRLIGTLLGVSGARPLTIVARTKANRRKTPYGDIYKLASVNGLVNFYYDDAVLRRLAKEGKSADDFRRGDTWHQPYIQDGKLTPISVNKKQSDKCYLRMMLKRTLSERYFDAEGNELSVNAVWQYLRDPNEAYLNQGCDDKVQIKVYSLDNILRLTLDGETYDVDREVSDPVIRGALKRAIEQATESQLAV